MTNFVSKDMASKCNASEPRLTGQQQNPRHVMEKSLLKDIYNKASFVCKSHGASLSREEGECSENDADDDAALPSKTQMAKSLMNFIDECGRLLSREKERLKSQEDEDRKLQTIVGSINGYVEDKKRMQAEISRLSKLLEEERCIAARDCVQPPDQQVKKLRELNAKLKDKVRETVALNMNLLEENLQLKVEIVEARALVDPVPSPPASDQKAPSSSIQSSSSKELEIVSAAQCTQPCAIETEVDRSDAPQLSANTQLPSIDEIADLQSKMAALAEENALLIADKTKLNFGLAELQMELGSSQMCAESANKGLFRLHKLCARLKSEHTALRELTKKELQTNGAAIGNLLLQLKTHFNRRIESESAKGNLKRQIDGCDSDGALSKLARLSIQRKDQVCDSYQQLIDRYVRVVTDFQTAELLTTSKRFKRKATVES